MVSLKQLATVVVQLLSCVPLFATPWTARLLCPQDFPGRNTEVGCHSLLQGLNLCLLCLLHWHADSLPLSHLECSPACSVQFSSLSHVRLLATPWTAAHQTSLSITNTQSLLKLMSIESVLPSNHLILCRPLLLPTSIFPSIRVFFNESGFHIRWPKYCSFSFTSVLPKNIQG